MALVKCKECGQQVSNKAKSCPHCGTEPPKKTSFVTWAVLALILFVVYGAWQNESSQTPEQIKAREEQRASAAKTKDEAQAREVAQKAEDDKEKRLKGFHCLSNWDGSHTVVKKYVEDQMRDPDSFEHVETGIYPIDENGKHLLVMKYRAANGFGGLSIGNAIASVDNASCKATIISIE
jgi:hypothetical protein